MHKLVFATILALVASHATDARAADDTKRFYAGIATGISKSTLENSAGERFSSKKHPLPLKLYGGVDLSEHVALEAGVSATAGKHMFDQRLFGTVTEPRLASRAFYLAAKGTVAVSDKVDLHAKVGAARSRFELTDAGVHDRTLSATKPMFGVGAAYKLTDSAAATLEFEHYGTVREQGYKLSQRRLQAGIRFGF
ncbi:MAG: outer membrane beta-barrel protein [Janthinobacterium lividum]